MKVTEMDFKISSYKIQPIDCITNDQTVNRNGKKHNRKLREGRQESDRLQSTHRRKTGILRKFYDETKWITPWQKGM